MLAAFVMSWWHYLLLGYSLLLSLGESGWRAVPKRLLLFFLDWCLFGLLNALHWLGFLIDELVFPGYRLVSIHQPVSIVGVPRSGTTYLQRVLSKEPAFTTLTLYECVLAPSISERYFWFGMARLLRPLVRVGWPFRRSLSRSLRRSLRMGFLSMMENIHELGLMEPEEDFLLLLWIGACFLFVVPCPAESRYWRLARFDQRLHEPTRQRVLEFYRRCLQKHLYFHGEQLRLLSKNPSFTPMINSLRETFPDVVLVACVRGPGSTVPSQLSSLLPAFTLLGQGGLPTGFQSKMIETLHHYYAQIDESSREGLAVVSMSRLNDEVATVVGEILAAAGLVPSAEFEASLGELEQTGRGYRSGHQYAVTDFGLTDEQIQHFFSDVWPLS